MNESILRIQHEILPGFLLHAFLNTNDFSFSLLWGTITGISVCIHLARLFFTLFLVVEVQVEPFEKVYCYFFQGNFKPVKLFVYLYCLYSSGKHVNCLFTWTTCNLYFLWQACQINCLPKIPVFGWQAYRLLVYLEYLYSSGKPVKLFVYLETACIPMASLSNYLFTWTTCNLYFFGKPVKLIVYLKYLYSAGKPVKLIVYLDCLYSSGKPIKLFIYQYCFYSSGKPIKLFITCTASIPLASLSNTPFTSPP